MPSWREVRATDRGPARHPGQSRTAHERSSRTNCVEIAKTYGDARRSEFTQVGSLSIEDLLVDEEMVITMSHEGYVKRLPLTTYRAQRRGGRGLQGVRPKDDDWIEHLYTAQTHDYLMVFTVTGHCYWLKVHEIPVGTRESRGKPIVNILALSAEERIAAVVPVREFSDDRYLVFATRRGTVKKTALSAYRNIRVSRGERHQH